MIGFLLAAGIEGLAQTSNQSSNVNFARGIKCLKQQNWQGAISSFRDSLKAHPHRADTMFYLSQAYYLSGQLNLAVNTIAGAVRLEPQSAVMNQKYGEYLCEAGECVKGLSMLLEARHLQPGLEHINLDVGMAYYRLSNLDKATQNIQIAFRKEPRSALAAFLLAECYSLVPDWPRAENMYRRALADGKQDAATYYGLGVALLRLGDTASALSSFRKALAIDPTLSECHFQMARALRTLGHNSEAKQQMKIFQAMYVATNFPTRITTNDKPVQKAFWIGCKRLLERGKEHEVLLRFRSVNGGRQPYFLLGTLYYNMGHFSDAQRVLNISTMKNPQNASAWAWLGWAEMALGDNATADASFRQALKIDPDSRMGMAGMGAILHSERQWAKSAEWIERSNTRDPATLLDLCDDYLQLGDQKDAKFAAELVRSFGVGDKTIISALDNLLSSH